MFGFALCFSMSELLEVVYFGIEDHMANPLSDFGRNIFFLTNACKLQCFVQFGAELNWTSTYVFLIVWRKSTHCFMLYLSVRAFAQ